MFPICLLYEVGMLLREASNCKLPRILPFQDRQLLGIYPDFSFLITLFKTALRFLLGKTCNVCVYTIYLRAANEIIYP